MVASTQDSRFKPVPVPASATPALLGAAPLFPVPLGEVAWADVTGAPPLGTASPLNVPSSGNATAGQVVLGNDGRLTDARTPLAHTHTAANVTDFDTQVRTSRLDQMAAPSASVNFAGQQVLSFRLENRTSDPGSPTTGQIWLRTDI